MNTAERPGASGYWVTLVLAAAAAVVAVAVIRMPFAAPLLGNIEEWGILGRYTEHGVVFITSLGSTMPHLALRPLNIFTFALSYVLAPDSFFGWNFLLNLSFVTKATAMAGIVWWLTRQRWLAVVAGLLLMLYPADTMQMSLRAVHINFAVALTLLACLFVLIATEARTEATRGVLALQAFGFFLTGSLMYEAGLFLAPLPALLWWARYGFVDGVRRLPGAWVPILFWAAAIVVAVAYLLIVGRTPGIYQQSISNSPVSTLSLLASRWPMMFTVGAYRAFAHGWFDAARMLLSQLAHWPYLVAAGAAVLVSGAIWFRPAPSRAPDAPPPSVGLGARLVIAGFAAALAGYLPYLSSLSHILITQRTYIYASAGASLLIVGLIILVARGSRTLGVLVAAALLSLGLASQWTQYDHYSTLSLRARAILAGLLEAAPRVDSRRTILVIDRSGSTGSTWLLRGELLDAAMTYLYGAKADFAVCLEPGMIYSTFAADAQGRPGRCAERETEWVVGEGLAAPLRLAKDGLLTLTIEPDGTVVRKGPPDPVPPSPNDVRRWRSILECWPAQACAYIPPAREDGSFRYDFGQWWSLEQAPWGAGWRDAEWNPPRLQPVSYSWMIAPEARLWFNLKPRPSAYVLRVRVANWISASAKTELQFRLNGASLQPAWKGDFVVEAAVPAGTARPGLNELVLASPIDPVHGISLAVDRVELEPRP